MRKHLEDNDSSAVAAVLDQLHEALRDLLHSEDAVVLLQHGPVLLPPIRVVYDCSVCERWTDALREGCRKKNAAKVWSFTKPPSDPPPPRVWSFLREKN